MHRSILVVLILAGCSSLPPQEHGPKLIVTPQNRVIHAGEQIQFTASLMHPDGSTEDVTNSVQWSSSDISVADITPTAMATGFTGGKTTITATLGGTLRISERNWDRAFSGMMASCTSQC